MAVSIDTAPRRILPSASVIESLITSSSHDALDLQLNRPHELEHFHDDGVGHLRFLDDVVERLERFLAVGQLALEHAGHDLDARQRILDLVRDRRGHLAERRQAVAQALPLLDLLDARQVLEEQRRADHARRRRRECARACSRWRGPSCAGAFRRGSAGRRSRTPAAARGRLRGSRAAPPRTAGRCRPVAAGRPRTRYAMSFIAATRPSRVIASTPVRRLKTRCRKNRSPMQRPRPSRRRGGAGVADGTHAGAPVAVFELSWTNGHHHVSAPAGGALSRQGRTRSVRPRRPTKTVREWLIGRVQESV